MVLTAYSVLSPVSEFLFVTVIGGLRQCLHPVGPTRLRKFSTSNGCQDHTASPSATTSFVLRAVRSLTGFIPPCASLARLTLPRPPHPIPTFVTMAKRPSVGRDSGGFRSDLGQAGNEIFLQRGLDRQFTDLPVGQISGWVPPACRAASELDASVVEALFPLADRSNNVCCEPKLTSL